MNKCVLENEWKNTDMSDSNAIGTPYVEYMYSHKYIAR